MSLSLASLTACEINDLDDPDDNLHVAEMDLGDGPTPTTFRDVDGMAVVGGDMILTTTEHALSGTFRLPPLLAPRAGEHGDVIFSAVRTRAWPDGVIPYELVSSELNWGLENNIMAAIDTWNATGAVRFVPANSSDDHVLLIRGPSSSMGPFEGSAQLGFKNDPTQHVRLGAAAGTPLVIHELGHAMGLIHEHMRTDRDSFININTNNIQDGKEDNFDILSGSDDMNFRGYDINSVMHYSSDSFSKNIAVLTISRQGCGFSRFVPGCQITPSTTPTSGDVRGVLRIHAGEPVRLRNDMNDRCMRPSGGSTSSGAAVITSSCNNTSSRRWFKFNRSGSGTMLVNEHSRMCLTVPTSGNGLIQAPCTGVSRQRFDVVSSSGGFQFRQRGTTRCVRRIESQSQLILSSRCNNTVSRRWFEQ